MSRSQVIYRLVIPASLWNAAFGELVTHRRDLAWGRLRRSFHGFTCDLIVDRMRFRRELPNGSELSSLDDWIVISCPTHPAQEALRRAVDASSLKEGQLMVLVQPGLGVERNGWTGVVIENDKAYPLDEIHLVGPQMPIFNRLADEGFANRESDDRWSRQSGALGEKVFQRFRKLNVVLIGAGRLGSLIAEGLIRSGLDRLAVVDPDVLEPHNLNATIGSRSRDIGIPKVQSLVAYLHRVQPDALLSGLQRTVNHPDVFEKARPADLLVSCVDNDEARHQASNIASRLVKVHLDLGTIVRRPADANVGSRQAIASDANALDYAREIAADVRLLLPGCCVECVRAESITSDVTENRAIWQLGGRAGSLISINYLAVGCGMQMLFDFLAGSIRGSFWQRMRWQQGAGIESIAGYVRSNGNCEFCRPIESTARPSNRRNG